MDGTSWYRGHEYMDVCYGVFYLTPAAYIVIWDSAGPFMYRKGPDISHSVNFLCEVQAPEVGVSTLASEYILNPPHIYRFPLFTHVFSSIRISWPSQCICIFCTLHPMLYRRELSQKELPLCSSCIRTEHMNRRILYLFFSTYHMDRRMLHLFFST